MSKTQWKLTTVIRARAERELKAKLENIAAGKRKTFGAFVREELWKIVESETASTAKKKVA